MVFPFLKKLFPPQPPLPPENLNPDEYHIFTDKFDKEVNANEIDLHIGTRDWPAWAKACNNYKSIAQKWKLNAAQDWEAGISRLLADPHFDDHRIAISILIDHSGSMKGDKAFLACAIAEVLASVFYKLGVQYEILGFTTSTWCGGSSRREWIQSGSPNNPGRLCDLLHIIYEPFSKKNAKVGKSIHNIFREKLLKENVDGEALIWASTRFPKTGLDKRILIVVSDGAPVDDSTLACNPKDFLCNHLKEVIADLTAQDINIVGIGLKYDISRYYPYSTSISTPEQMGTCVSKLLVPLLTPK